MKDEIIKIARHRMGIDGRGVSTLVAFWGCPLRCKYCINDFCHNVETKRKYIDPQELCERISIDDIYFRMSGGGVVFGGGEPIVHSEYIEEFCKIKPKHWEIRLETSLYCDWQHVERLIPYVDQWIIDVKDMNPEIYMSYTGADGEITRNNIFKLAENVDESKLMFRIPHIPGYNTDYDVRSSRQQLEKYGRIDIFKYIDK